MLGLLLEFKPRGVAMETFRVLAELIERIRLELLALGGLRRGDAAAASG